MVTKVFNNIVFKEGDTYPFSIKVGEKLSAPALNTTVVITISSGNITINSTTIPVGTSFVAVDSSTYLWTIGTLNNTDAEGFFEIELTNDDDGYVELDVITSATINEINLSNNSGNFKWVGLSYNQVLDGAYKKVATTGGTHTVTNETHLYAKGGDTITLPATLDQDLYIYYSRNSFGAITINSSTSFNIDSSNFVVAELNTGYLRVYHDSFYDTYIVTDFSLSGLTQRISSFSIENATIQDLQINGTGVYSVDWGDGNFDYDIATGVNIQHTYTTPYTGDIRVISNDNIESITGIVCSPNSQIVTLPALIFYTTLERLELKGTNSIGFIDIEAPLPATLSYLEIDEISYALGDLSSVTVPLTYLKLILDTSDITYSFGRVWSANMEAVILTPAIGGLPEAEVDQLLIDLAATTWTGVKIVTINGTNEPPSVASAAAIVTLQGLGVTVTTN